MLKYRSNKYHLELSNKCILTKIQIQNFFGGVGGAGGYTQWVDTQWVGQLHHNIMKQTKQLQIVVIKHCTSIQGAIIESSYKSE